MPVLVLVVKLILSTIRVSFVAHKTRAAFALVTSAGEPAAFFYLRSVNRAFLESFAHSCREKGLVRRVTLHVAVALGRDARKPTEDGAIARNDDLVAPLLGTTARRCVCRELDVFVASVLVYFLVNLSLVVLGAAL